MLREHTHVLLGERAVLRPLTENDWDLLLKWNNDPEVLYFAEGDDVNAYTLDQIQRIWRGVSQTAFCFVIDVGDVPIGECWLQQMNLERVLHKYPKSDCWRIDLAIGEKTFWGQGAGTEVIRLLSAFAFDEQHADLALAVTLRTTTYAASERSRRRDTQSMLRSHSRPARKHGISTISYGAGGDSQTLCAAKQAARPSGRMAKAREHITPKLR